MKTIKSVLRLAILIALTGITSIGVFGENLAAINEVVKLKDSGMSDDIIISYVKGKNVNYDLSVDNILALRDKGLSSAVLNVMLTSGKKWKQCHHARSSGP